MEEEFKTLKYNEKIFENYEINKEGIVRKKDNKYILKANKGMAQPIYNGIVKGISTRLAIEYTFEEINSEERWKPLVYKNIEYKNYLCSNLGRIRQTKKNSIIESYKNSQKEGDYLRFSLPNKINPLTHRVICETWIPNIDQKKEVNHKNGNKQDNRIENLEWSTRSENILHAFKNNLKDSSSIIKKVKIVELKKEFNSIIECARFLIQNKYSKATERNCQKSICVSITNKKPYINFTFEHSDA